jgi:HAD superfamily hydrolase (TIGR01549 family)
VRPSKDIRIILFDLDGTLRHNQPSSEHTFLNFAVQLGAVESPDRRRNSMRWAHYYWAESPILQRDLEVFKDQEEDFWINYAYRHLLAFGCSQEQAHQLAQPLQNRMVTEYSPRDVVFPETIATLHDLKEGGFRLGLVTNRRSPCDDQLVELGLMPYLEATVIAGSVSAWKPNPLIFKHALKLLKASPEEAVYVGDNYFADVIGARRAGIRPVLLDPEGVFIDPDCEVICRIEELPLLLEEHQP